MHGDELKYVTEAYETNWMSTVGKNINEVERLIAERVGVRYAVALSAGTASLHLAMKLAGEAMYGQSELGKGALSNKKIFCSDVTFDATVNPVVYAFIRLWRTNWGNLWFPLVPFLCPITSPVLLPEGRGRFATQKGVPMKENDNILLLLQDIKDMLMDLGIMIASLLVAALLGSLLGVFAFWIAVILAVAGLGVVWQGWRNHKTAEKQD